MVHRHDKQTLHQVNQPSVHPGAAVAAPKIDAAAWQPKQPRGRTEANPAFLSLCLPEAVSGTAGDRLAPGQFR